MIRYRRRYWIVAACLAAVAGFVDAVAFIDTGGFFVSFMSGNSTRLGVGLATLISHAAIAVGLIGSFLLGVMAGALAGRREAGAIAKPVLWLVALLLAAAALAHLAGFGAIAVALLAAAMGAENGVFQRDGEVSISVTYMTGTLVKLGQRLVAALMGGPRFDWAPYLVLWLGLVLGAFAGAIAYQRFNLSAIWIAAAGMAVMAIVAPRLRESPALGRITS